MPINGLRHPVAGDTNGWYIGTEKISRMTPSSSRRLSTLVTSMRNIPKLQACLVCHQVTDSFSPWTVLMSGLMNHYWRC